MQWLKQIDNTEAALTQKMIDLENDKVQNQFIMRIISKCLDPVELVDGTSTNYSSSDPAEYVSCILSCLFAGAVQ